MYYTAKKKVECCISPRTKGRSLPCSLYYAPKIALCNATSFIVNAFFHAKIGPRFAAYCQLTPYRRIAQGRFVPGSDSVESVQGRRTKGRRITRHEAGKPPPPPTGACVQAGTQNNAVTHSRGHSGCRPSLDPH